MDILKSWQTNAEEWIKVINDGDIASRKVTSPAVVKTVGAYHPAKVLDLGCGEGWLTRALNELNIPTTGIDATPALIDRAKKQGNGVFDVLSFEEIIKGNPISGAPYEAIVLNFCLYMKEETIQLLNALKNHLEGERLIIIQTLHPISFQLVKMKYEDQWLDDSWKGLPGNFVLPHRWYFRTLSCWLETLTSCGLILKAIEEPMAEEADKPSSIIFVCQSQSNE
ncbi:methyltransferase domain-containing protein [Fulvivirga sp. M361]|uniref:class I SAM-dependent methyltransferase n=1 Tax=Fulvivirga sp. M361 TaxID=2594266 RepID=UPI00117A57ED|nr:class I SAM-dependent methyltransferase [Fulvivirga sp. M361]TRX50927.1 methyltransferase domain-containing protein [Fulvivirga sp. M361]